MQVGIDHSKYSIQIPLSPKIDPTVILMTVKDKPDVTDDVGGAKESMEKLWEVLEMPLLHPKTLHYQGATSHWPEATHKKVSEWDSVGGTNALIVDSDTNIHCAASEALVGLALQIEHNDIALIILPIPLQLAQQQKLTKKLEVVDQ